MAKAEELEATFLSEMLAHSGLGGVQGPFGGGPGEGDAAGFQDQDARILRPGLVLQDQGNERRLARAGRGDEDGVGAGAQRATPRPRGGPAR